MNTLIKTVLFLLCFPAILLADTLYMATTGTDSGTCVIGSPCLTLQYSMSQMTSGDTLEIADGTYNYTGSAGYDNWINDTYNPPSGPGTGSGDSRFTIIKAENEGQVLFDLSTNTRFIELYSANTDYIKLVGIKATTNVADEGVILMSDSTSQRWYLRRCGFAAFGGQGASTVRWDGNYLIMEECYTWGRGRYGLQLSAAGDYSVVRRCVFRQDAAECDTGAAVVAGMISYEADYIEVQNSIILDGDVDSWTMYGSANPPTYPYGGFITHTAATDTGSDYNYFRGNIVLNVDTTVSGNVGGFGFLNDQTGCTNNVFENNIVWAFQGYGIHGGNGASDVISNSNTVGLITDDTNSSGDGIRYFNGSNNTVINNIVYGCRDDGLLSNIGSDYNDVNGNGDNYDGTSIGANDVSYSPLTNGLLYLPRIETASNLKSAGSVNQIGAEVVKRYGIDGTFYGEDTSGEVSTDYKDLTATDLWPFPYEDQIKTDLSADTGTTTETRGFCTTGNQLDGVTEVTLTSYIWEYLGNQIPSDIYNLGNEHKNVSIGKSIKIGSKRIIFE